MPALGPTPLHLPIPITQPKLTHVLNPASAKVRKWSNVEFPCVNRLCWAVSSDLAWAELASLGCTDQQWRKGVQLEVDSGQVATSETSHARLKQSSDSLILP